MRCEETVESQKILSSLSVRQIKNRHRRGTRPARFLPQGKMYSSIARYTVRQSLYLHACVNSFDRALRLPGRDS